MGIDVCATVTNVCMQNQSTLRHHTLFLLLGGIDICCLMFDHTPSVVWKKITWIPFHNFSGGTKKLIVLWHASFECKRILSYLTNFIYFTDGKILICHFSYFLSFWTFFQLRRFSFKNLFTNLEWATPCRASIIRFHNKSIKTWKWLKPDFGHFPDHQQDSMTGTVKDYR